MISALGEFGEWLQQHDLTIDLVTVWGLALGFALLGVVKGVSWWALRSQDDATMVGITLKRQKMAESLLLFGMATLYGMTLYSYYMSGPQFGFWDRLALRTGLFGAILLAAFYGVQFVYWLRRESKGWETKSARDDRQDAREDGLDERADRQDERARDLDHREEEAE